LLRHRLQAEPKNAPEGFIQTTGRAGGQAVWL